MSVVAVRKYKDKIVISADKQVSWGDCKFTDVRDNMYENKAKLFQINDVVLGCSGSVEESVLFGIFLKTHKPKAATPDDIIDLLVEFKDWASKRDGEFKLENHYIFVYDKKAFQVVRYDVQEIHEYNAIGSGMFLALGALYKGATPEEAVDVAKVFDLYCGGETDTIVVDLK